MQPVPTGQVTYDGTAESRIRIRNWMDERLDDPAPDGVMHVWVQDQTGSESLVKLEKGMTIVRHPNGKFGIQQVSTQAEAV